MKPISLNIPRHQERHGNVAEPLPTPKQQSDSTRSNFSNSGDVNPNYPYARIQTSGLRIEFSHSEPSRRTPQEWLSQIEAGKTNSRMKTIA